MAEISFHVSGCAHERAYRCSRVRGVLDRILTPEIQELPLFTRAWRVVLNYESFVVLACVVHACVGHI